MLFFLPIYCGRKILRKLLFQKKKLKVITIKALRERNFGRFEGKHLIELRKTFGEVMLITVEKQKNYNFLM